MAKHDLMFLGIGALAGGTLTIARCRLWAAFKALFWWGESEVKTEAAKLAGGQQAPQQPAAGGAQTPPPAQGQ